MNDGIGQNIGETIGLVKHFDIPTESSGWGNFLTMHIELELYKPLSRGMSINLLGRKSGFLLSMNSFLDCVSNVIELFMVLKAGWKLVPQRLEKWTSLEPSSRQIKP